MMHRSDTYIFIFIVLSPIIHKQPAPSIGTFWWLVPAAQELLNTRKAPGSLQEAGFGAGPKAADRPAEPARWVMDDSFQTVFSAWNLGAKNHVPLNSGVGTPSKMNMEPQNGGLEFGRYFFLFNWVIFRFR